MWRFVGTLAFCSNKCFQEGCDKFNLIQKIPTNKHLKTSNPLD